MVGRPQFKPTPTQRNRVKMLRADGWSQERIARLIGIDVQTLLDRFSEEMEHGADMKRAELLQWAEKGAKKGNPSLIKWLGDQRLSADSGASGGLGKKEQRQAAAGRVEGVFAPPDAPKLVVNNG